MPLRLLPNHNPYSNTRHFLSHTLHYITPTTPTPYSIHDAAAAKSNAVSNMQLSLILHLSAPAAWQYTPNPTQPTMNQHTVSNRHSRSPTPVHRCLKRTTQYLLTGKITPCSSWTTPDFPPTLAPPFCCMQRHPLQQIPATQILLTNCKPTASPPS